MCIFQTNLKLTYLSRFDVVFVSRSKINKYLVLLDPGRANTHTRTFMDSFS